MIIFKEKNGKVLLQIYKSSQFETILKICKSYGGNKYIPDERSWQIAEENLPEILPELKKTNEEIQNEQLLEKHVKAVKAEETLPEFPMHYLKCPPISGKAPYENFQLEDIRATYARKRFAIFNDTGTGKSFIILSVLNAFWNEGKINKILYITSNSGVWDLYGKIKKFTDIPQEKVTVGNRYNRRPFEQADKQFILCNYRSFLLMAEEYGDAIIGKKGVELLKIFKEKVKEWVGDVTKAVIICDESHNIANITAKQTIAIHQVKNFFDYRYVLTGTPADKEEKYYSQLAFLNESLVENKNYYHWLLTYANCGNRFSRYAINSWKKDKLAFLQKLVAKNCTRRLAKDVLELPDKIEKTITLDIYPEHWDIYTQYAREYLNNQFSSSTKILTKDFMTCVPALVLALDNPKAVKTEKISDSLVQKIKKFNFATQHIKVEVVKDILLDHSDEKAIIWTSHPSVGTLLAEALKEYNPLVINGETREAGLSLDEFKNKVIEQFQTKSEHKVLIAGVQVLNSAVTITEASVQIYFDTDFNYTTTKQSEARIYRIGQDKVVHTYKLIANNTLDVTRAKIMENKNFVNEKFLSKEYLDNESAEALLFGKY